MVDAIKGGRREEVARVIQEDPGALTARDASGASPLLLAIYHQKHDIAGMIADAIGAIDEPYHQALAYFAFGALQQFYFDGNKRTARLMACGHLLTHGYEAISVPAARKLEFNETMVDFYVRRDATALFAFLATCAIA